MLPNVSRLVISELVVPLSNADAESGWLDLTMMAMGGGERTERQWLNLLGLSGLKLKKFGAPAEA